MKLPKSCERNLCDAETQRCAQQLEAALPDAQVMDFREGNPALTRGPG